MIKMKGFGCGFDVLFFGSDKFYGDEQCNLLVECLCFGKYQLCIYMDEDLLVELVILIKFQGIMQLILVCVVDGMLGVECYEIVVGECCWCVV